MLKCLKTVLLSLAAMSIVVGSANAKDRYAQRPNVIISPDLAAPWVLQLRNGPGRVQQRGIQVQISGIGVMGLGTQAPRKKVRALSPQQDFGIVRVEQPTRRLPEPVVQQVAATSRATITVEEATTIDEKWLPQQVSYNGNEKPGTIVIETSQRMLYLVQGNGEARRYGVGVGKPGFEWAGRHKISRKSEWPDWRPPAEMIQRVRQKEGRILPVYMAGGPENPLGARAMYLGNSLYRIHGTNQPWTIGKNVSSGCIRMRNEDVTDLYERVGVGTQVIVR